MSHAARCLPSQVRPGHPTQPLEVVAFLGLLLVVFPGVALGEPPLARSRAASPDQAGPNVVPPRLIEQTAVPYPDGASGDALMVVVVTVNADGTVRSAQAQAEMPPVSDAAVKAVQGWRLEPATRDKVRIAAMIR